MKINRQGLIVSCVATGFALIPVSAMAYTGPGAGITALGSLLALVAAVLLGIIGFVWYPVKRLLKPRSKASNPSSSGSRPS